MDRREDLRRIRALTEAARYGEALDYCDRLLGYFRGKVGRAELLHRRADIYESSGKWELALDDRREIFALGEGSIRDYYKAAESAAHLGDYDKAREWANNALRLGRELDEPWFRSACFVMLSYVCMQLGDYREAMINLRRAVSLDPHGVVPQRRFPYCYTYTGLQDEIKRRATLAAGDVACICHPL